MWVSNTFCFVLTELRNIVFLVIGLNIASTNKQVHKQLSDEQTLFRTGEPLQIDRHVIGFLWVL
jgi:hypothetical protein